jgi:hypothetical protein
MPRPNESYSDVILRLIELDAASAPWLPWASGVACLSARPVRFAGIPSASSTIDGPGVAQLLNRRKETLRAITGSGGRLHFE